MFWHVSLLLRRGFRASLKPSPRVEAEDAEEYQAREDHPPDGTHFAEVLLQDSRLLCSDRRSRESLTALRSDGICYGESTNYDY
jgi:hypothetical protein